jgi:hypothetical protein
VRGTQDSTVRYDLLAELWSERRRVHVQQWGPGRAELAPDVRQAVHGSGLHGLHGLGQQRLPEPQFHQRRDDFVLGWQRLQGYLLRTEYG